MAVNIAGASNTITPRASTLSARSDWVAMKSQTTPLSIANVAQEVTQKNASRAGCHTYCTG